MSGAQYIICSDCGQPYPRGQGKSFCPHDDSIGAQPPSALATQVGGNHYAKLGQYQPWQVLQRWLTPEEFRGYMKGEAIVYLAREQSKGGRQDIEKALHVLQGYLELTKGEQAEVNIAEKSKKEEGKYERKLENFTGIKRGGDRVGFDGV